MAYCGLDFGTTFSTISGLVNGEMKILTLMGTEYISTIVGITANGDAFVGSQALNLKNNNTGKYAIFYDLKRWVGVEKDSYYLLLKKINPEYHTEFRDNDVYTSGYNKNLPVSYSIRSLIALFIEAMGKLFSQQFKCDIADLNISVPADFSTKQRLYMRSILDKLSFPCKRIVNEPSAAAIYYTASKPNIRNFLVYDFGGGTFDLSYVMRYGKYLTVIDSAGDLFLGGRDIDKAIKEIIVGRLLKNIDLTPNQLEKIKIDVQKYGTSEHIIIDSDQTILKVKFNSQDLKNIVDKYVNRTAVLLDLIVDKYKIDNALLCLVGGSSLLDDVFSFCREYCKKRNLQLSRDENLRAVVSMGCSVLHHIENSGVMVYIDVSSHTLMDIDVNLNPQVIIRKPMSIPYTHSQTLKIRRHFNTSLDVYEGENTCPIFNDWLISANYSLKDIGNIGDEYSINYSYNVDGIITCFLINENTKKRTDISNKRIGIVNFEKLNYIFPQLNRITESVSLISILSYFNPKYFEYTKYVTNPSLFLSSVNSAGGFKNLYSELQTYNKDI